MKRALCLIAVVLLVSQPFMFKGSASATGLCDSQKKVFADGIPYFNSCTCDSSSSTQTPATNPTGGATGSVYMLGDSITFGSKDDLASDFKQAGYSSSYISARVSRSLSSPGSSVTSDGTADSYHAGLDQLDVDKSKIASSDTVIMALGTNAEINGSFHDNVTSAINKIKAANPNANIYWVNIFSNVPDHKAAYNSTLNSLSSSLGFTVIDTTGANISLSGDGIHPDTNGQQTYADLVAKAVSSSTTPAPAPDTSSACACTAGAIDSSSALVGNNNVQKAWNFFKSQGLNDAQTAGILGNLQDESGQNIDPEINQNGSGDSQTQPKTGGADGWGIAQWTYPSQDFDQLIKQYKISGPGNELATQLNLVLAQMKDVSPTGVKDTFSAIKQINDPGQAAAFFDTNFEGGVSGGRVQNATTLYGQRGQLNQSSGSTGGSTGGNATGASTTTSDILEGHKLPATVGGTGDEAPVDSSGHLTVGVGAVTFSQFASLGQNYRDYYITMRWRYALWNWDGTNTSGPEDSSWYGQKPRLVLVTNPRNHKSIIADIMESGPAPWTGVDTQSNNTPKEGWTNPQDGTPSGYTGRVSGFPPPAIQALGASQTTSDGSGDKLEYAWAPDQTAQPGPTTLQVNGTGGGSGDCSSSGGVNGGAYQNPFKDIPNIRPEGIDAGVDYVGDGPVHPIGPAKVAVSEPNSPWLYGNYISYTLTSGPAVGKTVYVAEDCTVNTALHQGQVIGPSDTVCTLNSKRTGLETGWANANNDLPLPYTDHCYYLVNPSLPKTSTAYGVNFNKLMVSLGVPNASLLGGPVTCTLPSGWQPQ
ncbi:MAG TPA: phage tail tip lysozyme [Candidatus Saccharimonadales bacterium]|nr:phage tail tip lysozyme [Candidatus Saccharimonadales bacterium]